jgi:multicomponent Na+:H+ antiporter subunit B
MTAEWEAAIAVSLLVFVVAIATLTAVVRDVLTAVVVFAAYSLGLAILWSLYRAPDVALTEAAVGAGVTTALLLLAISRTVRPASGRVLVDPRSIRLRSVAVAALVLVGLGLTVPALPAVGASDTPAFGPVPEFYLTDAADRGVDNAVTAVLVVYRGFDTFGEIAVVFAAAVAALAVLAHEDEPEPAVDVPDDHGEGPA